MNVRNLFILICLFIFARLFCAAADLPGEIKAGVSADASASSQEAVLKAYGGEFYSKFIEAAYYEKQGRYEAAFPIYEELYKSAPGDRVLLASLSALSLELQDVQAMNKYIPAYYSLAPQEADAMAMKAGLLWSQGGLKEAAMLYKSALEKSPDNSEIIIKYVTLLSALDGDEAIKYLEDLSARYPSMGSVIAVNIADLYLKQNDRASAVKYLKDYIARNPYAPEPYTVLAGIYEASGRPADALRTYISMDKAGLASADVLVKIGAYYTLDDKKNEALTYFRRAKNLDNGQPAAAQFLVLDAQNRGDYVSAVKFLKESSAYEAEPSFHIRASYFLSRAGRPEESAQVLKEAYEKFPDDAEIVFYYALALMDLEQWSAAEEILASALNSDIKSESLLLNYAVTLERQKKYKKMEAQLKKLLELDANNAEALNFYGYYLVDKTRRVEEGGKYIKSAVALKPDDAAFVDSLAWYYYKKGDYDEAYRILSSIPAQSVKALNDVEIWLHLGQTAQRLELWKEAADYYKAVLELDPQNKTAVKNLKKVSKKI